MLGGTNPVVRNDEQSFRLRRIERRLYRRERRAGALGKERSGKSFGKTQRVQHELERRLARRQALFAADGLRSAGVREIFFRLFYLPASHDAVRERELAVRAGAEPEVIAEA